MVDLGDIWPAEPWPPGWTVHHVAETGSTNTDLLAAAAAAAGRAGDRTVLAAAHQTAGRGRLDRTWVAPPGSNLLVSILFTDLPGEPSVLTSAVAVAAATAVEVVVPGRTVALKWPNDLLLDGAKLGGILAQRSADGVVVGLGLNVGWSPEGAADLGGAVTPSRLLAALLTELDPAADDLADRYRARLDTLGRAVLAELPDGETLRGTAIDLDRGRLVVRGDDGAERTLDVADVIHLTPETPETQETSEPPPP